MPQRAVQQSTQETIMKLGTRAGLEASLAALLVLAVANCRGGPAGGGAEDRLEQLPVLPSEIASTLDPATNATRIRPSQPTFVREPPAAQAPCCGSKDIRELKVRVSLTKCAPLRDFVMAPVRDLVFSSDTGVGRGGGQGSGGATVGAGAESNVRMFRLNTVNRRTVLDTIVCMTSDGPWDATFQEDRNCNNYAPQDSLLVSAWGGIVPYYWNGGTANHPPEVSVVSCRNVGLFKFACGGPSSCDCLSSPCPANQPCVCGSLPW
jgi:hypothetical protein